MISSQSKGVYLLLQSNVSTCLRCLYNTEVQHLSRGTKGLQPQAVASSISRADVGRATKVLAAGEAARQVPEKMQPHELYFKDSTVILALHVQPGFTSLGSTGRSLLKEGEMVSAWIRMSERSLQRLHVRCLASRPEKCLH